MELVEGTTITPNDLLNEALEAGLILGDAIKLSHEVYNRWFGKG